MSTAAAQAPAVRPPPLPRGQARPALIEQQEVDVPGPEARAFEFPPQPGLVSSGEAEVFAHELSVVYDDDGIARVLWRRPRSRCCSRAELGKEDD